MALTWDMSGSDLIVGDIKVAANTPGSAGTDITTADLTALAGVTAGTVSASKAVIVDGSKNIATFGTIGSGAITSTGASVLGSVTLGAGTTSVAPISLTSGTNLTTATSGAVEFDGNAFYATSQASSRQVVDAEQYIIQATEPAGDNNTGLDSASAAAVFTAGSGTITLAAGKTYFFEGQYMLTNSGTTSHTWGTNFGGTATFNALGTSYSVSGNSSGTANAAATGGLSGFLTGATLTTNVVCTPASTSATEQVVVWVQGTLSVNAGGTLIPRMQASARPGATGTPGVVHKAGSFFRIWQVPTLGSVGNWS